MTMDTYRRVNACVCHQPETWGGTRMPRAEHAHDVLDVLPVALNGALNRPS